jgi:hypothetical protein
LPICTMKTPPAIVLERSARSEPKAVEPQDFPWDIALQDIALVPPGNYHTKSEDGPYDEERGRTLKGLVTLLVNQGRYPRVRYQRYPPKMGSTAPADMPSCIVYTKTAMDCSAESRGEIRVSSHARDATQTAAWARVLDIPYSGQSLGVFTNRALDVILRRRHRKYLSRMNKDAMLEEQCHSCKLCGDTLGSDTIFDHIVPLHQLARALSGSMASSQAPSEFQAICGQCSANKTAKEPRASASALESHFTARVWEAYVQNPLPPNIIYKDADVPDLPMQWRDVAKHHMFDVVRCRRSALYYADALPVFSPLDDMVPVTHEDALPDLIYVDRPAPQPHDLQSLMSALPYLGPGWYHKVSVEYCLHTHRLDWTDLKWGVTASAHYPGDAVRVALDILEASWEDVQLESSKDRPWKRSINSMVGVWGMKDRVNITSLLSYGDVGEELYGPYGERYTQHDAYGAKGLTEYRRVTHVATSATFRPLYDLCLCTEHVRLAQGYQALRAAFVPRFPLKLVNVTVDGLIWEKPRKAVTTDKIEKLVADVTFERLPTLEDHIREVLPQHILERTQKRLKMTTLHPIQGVFPSTEHVFRVVTPKDAQHLRGNYTIKKCLKSDADPAAGYAWDDLSRAEAMTCILEGGSCFVQGIAGTGKSHFIREEILPELRSRGLSVTIVAKTHVAAKVAGGGTIDHFAWRHIREGGTNVDVVWVDEVSLLDIDLLTELNHLCFRPAPVQWLLSGDFNQYLPFFNSFRGQAVTKSFECSELLYHMAGGNRVTLTECMRSEQALFDYYASLIQGGSRFETPLEQIVQECRAMFHKGNAHGFIQGTHHAPLNFVVSHKRRVGVNKACNEADRVDKTGVVRFIMTEFGGSVENAPESDEKHESTNGPQDAYFWPGMKVVACKTTKALRNGEEYRIVEIGGTHVTMVPWALLTPAGAKPTAEGDADDGESVISEEQAALIELTRAVFFRSTRLPYGICYASIQGVTVEGLCALHDTGHSHFNRRMLFVALSRARSHESVIVH